MTCTHRQDTVSSATDAICRWGLTRGEVGTSCRLNHHILLSVRSGDIDDTGAILVKRLGGVIFVVKIDEYVVFPTTIAKGLVIIWQNVSLG